MKTLPRINPYKKEITYSIEEVAKKLSLSPEEVDEAVNQGLLRMVFFGKEERILAADLTEYIENIRKSSYLPDWEAAVAGIGRKKRSR